MERILTGDEDFVQSATRRTATRGTGVRAALVAVALLGLVLAAMPAQAATLDCTGTVTSTWIYPQGGYLTATIQMKNFYQTVSLSWTLCSLDSAVSGSASEVCGDVHAELMLAKATGKTVVVSFDDTVPATGGGVATTCADIWEFDSSVADHLNYVRVKNN